ncbi:sulfurtransferase complex subunit TusB [Methylogaea oryzae]|uniref:Multidrug MFS transporter n=1 Tax=Methylogaea oryzae TaxID=1295382 RepID=A0A8D5AJW2_9GAMM|nr:sulfurtransferase complex subunit TusB [Methylogaea oryzae]BBL70471.1 multidrug MFS transporter [Methylogaea oryzae]
MAVLHIVNRSPMAAPALRQCLARLGEDDSLLLIEDGVYAVAAQGEAAALLAGRRVYALEADLAARGLDQAERLAGVETVDYAGFVRMAAEHAQVLSWT